MDLGVPYSKFKILFVNIFSILYKAATLNPYKLQLDLREISSILQNSSDVPLLPHLLILLISLLLIAKFFFGYISVAANVVAIFPILTEEEPELLLPTMIAQAIESIFLNVVEIVLGYVTIRYYIPDKMSIFVIFIAKMLIKMSFCVATLNIYTDLYNNIKFPVVYYKANLFEKRSKEQFIKKQSLA